MVVGGFRDKVDAAVRWSRPTARRFCSRVPATGPSSSPRPSRPPVSRPSTARSRASRCASATCTSSRAARSGPSWPPTWRPAASTSTTWTSSSTSTRPTTPRRTCTARAVWRAPARTVAWSPSPRRSSSTRSCACSAAPALRCCTTTCARLRACSPPRLAEDVQRPRRARGGGRPQGGARTPAGTQAIPRPGWRAASSRGRSRRHPSSVHRWPTLVRQQPLTDRRGATGSLNTRRRCGGADDRRRCDEPGRPSYHPSHTHH